MILYYTELNIIITNNRNKTMHRIIFHETIVGKVLTQASRTIFSFVTMSALVINSGSFMA